MIRSHESLRRTALAVLAVIPVGFSVAACGSDPVVPDASFDPVITSDVDTFELQATDVSNVTVTVPFDWLNTGLIASIEHETTTSGGTARIVLRDATGITMYDEHLEQSLTEQSQTGMAGVWSGALILTDFSGNVRFRLLKA
ncbi:MAG: hypothetical protein MJB57_18265 [Gemmatimonadetes bacterium]|nr:hypothetical protein [Gemmatimonadota bacterium]